MGLCWAVQSSDLSTALGSHSRHRCLFRPQEVPGVPPQVFWEVGGYKGTLVATSQDRPRPSLLPQGGEGRKMRTGKVLKTNLFPWLPFSPAFPGQTKLPLAFLQHKLLSPNPCLLSGVLNSVTPLALLKPETWVCFSQSSPSSHEPNQPPGTVELVSPISLGPALFLCPHSHLRSRHHTSPRVNANFPTSPSAKSATPWALHMLIPLPTVHCPSLHG